MVCHYFELRHALLIFKITPNSCNALFKSYRNMVWHYFELRHALLIFKITPNSCYALFPLKKIMFLREFSFKKK